MIRIAAALIALAVVGLEAHAQGRTDLTPLLQAARSSNHEAAMSLVQQGADVNVAENDGTTALHWAANAGADALVAALIEAGADPNARNRYGLTPLQAAADGGFAVSVVSLLDAGANANAVLPEGETVLMTAARSGNGVVLQALVDSGAELEARDGFYGETALIWAAIENHANAVSILAMSGADIDAGSAAMDYRSRRAGQSVLGLGEWTPIMYAARENSLAAGRALIDAGADLDLKDPDGATALVIAIINAHYEFAGLLLDAGADANIVDNEAGMGPLYAAVDMHRLTVGHGRGSPPPVGLMTALDIARALLEHGADPNVTLTKAILTRTHTMGDSALGEGATALFRAAKSGDIEMIRLLVEHGADPMATMPNGSTAMHFVAGLGWRNGSPIAPSYDQGSEEEAVLTIDYLLELGLEINATNEGGDTPLHAAISGRGSEVIIAHLIERGADPLAENERGQTPLAVAQVRSTAAIAALVSGAASGE